MAQLPIGLPRRETCSFTDMTDREMRLAIAEALGYERLVLDYESPTPEPGLEQGADGIWRTASANKWQAQIEAQGVQCVGNYFVRVADGEIFADFDGPDTGRNGRGEFDWLSDLNAMHAAIMAQPQTIRDSFNHRLMESQRPNDAHVLDRTINATAQQRAEAFLRVIGKWKD